MSLNKNKNNIIEGFWSISQLLTSGIGKSIVFSRGHNFRTVYETTHLNKIELSGSGSFSIGLYNISGELMGTIGGSYAQELVGHLRHMTGSGGRKVNIGWLNYAKSFWSHPVKSTSNFYNSLKSGI